MVAPYTLREDIRERLFPQVSAYGLAEYIVADPNRQESVLHDQRFQNRNVIPKNRDAVRAVVAYCTDVSRPKDILARARAALEEKSASLTFKPNQREDAARCVETIDLFIGAKQSLSADAMAFFTPPDFEPLEIGGTKVSLQPDLLVGSTFPPQAGTKVGVVLIRPQKTPDVESAKSEATREARREYRREAGRYMLTMAQMLIASSTTARDQFDVKRSFVWDIRLGEAVPFPSDWVSRQKKIEAAGRQIRRLWETIEPSPSIQRR